MTAQAGDTLFSKQQLRQQLRARRGAQTTAQRNQAARKAAQRALQLRVLREARKVAIYLACGSELSTAPLLRELLQRGCKVHVPKLCREGMRFIAIRRNTALLRNHLGIREPARGARRHPRKMDVILLPLVGFDAGGTRLGAGGGYYDRALAFPRSFRRPLRVGYAYAAQQVETLPCDPWDVRLDVVITEKGILRWRTG